jgi:hypothetical protein
LGSVVIKPVPNKLNQPLIGKTLLSHFPNKDGNEQREYLWSDNESSIYGIPFRVKTLPFQAQDQAVYACATISLWTVNNKIKDLFSTPHLSPIEITNRAIKAIEENKSFPSSGLTSKQMFAFFRSIELDCEYINIKYMKEIITEDKFSKTAKDKYREKLNKIAPDTIKAFMHAKIPIIATLIIRKNNNNRIELEDYHTVIISGYKHDIKGKVTKLYIHDDQIGPYCRTTDMSGDGSFLKWKSEWITEHGEMKLTSKGSYCLYTQKLD